MGKFIWHDWARYVSISASIYLVWASIWGLLYRKFFFDFIDRTYTTGNPPLPMPNVKYAPILSVIVTIPLIQILAMLMAIITVAFEYPAPFLKGTFMERNFAFKMVWLLMQATLAILFYQGTNAFIWSVIAAGAYARALALGEVMPEAKAQRGKGGGSRV
jgi:hypothetical protein